jgi:hypothetical protein
MKGILCLRQYIFTIYVFCMFVSLNNVVYGQKQVLDSEMHHLRNSSKVEWAEFPRQAEGKQLITHFTAQTNNEDQTLQIRQDDVKQAWHVLLNGHELGVLTRDENDMVIYLNIPPGVLNLGENTLYIEPGDTIPDDIRIGQIVLEARPVNEVLSEATLHIEVVDGESNTLLPVRITVVNTDGALQTVGASSGNHLAVRPGFIYTGNGKASFGLPAGIYRIYAGRGFEYGIDSVQLVVRPGEQVHRKLIIHREVPTDGWISTDTHIHTFTHSGHGDATVEERVLTIAGEGIELPIITDHNVHVDIEPVAEAMQVRSYFTPITGNEMTTHIGHFNIFPATVGSPIPDHQVEDWNAVSRNIANTPGVEVVILNHARDIHSGFRPFGQEHHLAIAGLNLEGWEVPANAMEVVNSGAQQTDMMRLFYDWFGMLNRDHFLTPVGASDSHDVSRYVVGQARTYIQSNSGDPSRIDVREAVKNFREGKVMVSFGLLAEIVVDSLYGPGDFVPASDHIAVSVRVLGPGWTQADRISLYANGQKIREAAITEGKENTAGVKWSGTWTLPRPKHDIFLVAIAEGPGNFMPFWPVAKPYQPASPDWIPRVIGSTGAVWIDADRDGYRTSAYAYAKELLKASQGNIHKLIKELTSYDEAVAVQVAALLQEQGRVLTEHDIYMALQQAAPATKAGFQKFIEAWQTSSNI